MVSPGGMTSGTNVSRVSSRLSRPSSRSCITSTAVNVLVLDATRNWWSASGAVPGSSRSADADALVPHQRAAADDAGEDAGQPAGALSVEDGAVQAADGVVAE